MLPSSQKFIKHYIKYPLMWVALLWAVTLPGQEVEVYRFLFSGFSEEHSTASVSGQVDKNTAVLQAEGVQAFLDAKASSYFVIKLPLALDNTRLELPLLVSICFQESVGSCSSFFFHFLSRLLLSALQPNAP